MATVCDYQQLEQQVLNLLGIGDSVDQPTVPPSSSAALVQLARAAEVSQSAEELWMQASYLSATALQLDLFAAGELKGKEELLVTRLGQTSQGSSFDGSSEVRLCETRSALAFTIRARRPVVIADLREEPRFNDTFLAQRNARSGICCPVRYANRQYGAIGVFGVTPREFSCDNVLFMNSAALLLGPAIAHQRAEKALTDQSKFLASTMDSLESVVLLLSNDGQILRINRACQELGGYQLEEIRHRSIWGAFLLPEETAVVHEAFARLRNGEASAKCDTFLLTKFGHRCRISWTFSQLPFKVDRGPSIVASGVDVTEQHTARVQVTELQEKLKDLSARLPTATAATAATPSRHALMEAYFEGEKQHEGRAHPRRPYPYVQTIGPCYGGRLPAANEFLEVRCRDISPRGFSFITSALPDFAELIIYFGSPPHQICLRSRIIHTTPFVFEGHPSLLIGCEYTDRVETGSCPS